MRKIPPFLMLDAWRGVAALWVVMVHSCLPFVTTTDHGRFVHFPLYAVSVWGQLGVVMFFVISGYCVMGAAYSALTSGKSVGSYGLARLWRIYPPYLAALMATIGLALFIDLAQTHRLLPPSGHPLDYSLWNQPRFWLANLLILQMELNEPALVQTSWSLCYEIVFYVLIGILLVVAKADLRRSPGVPGTSVFQIGITGLTVTSLVWLLILPDTCPFPLDRWYQFGLGAHLFLVFAAEPGSPARRAQGQLILAGTLVLLFAALHSGSSVLGQPSSRLQAATSLVFVALLVGLWPYDAYLAHRHVLRPFIWLGTISYSVYLIHLSVIAFPDVGGRRLGFDHDWYWITYFLEIATSLAAGWLFYHLVERHFISSRQKRRIEAELNK